MNNIIKILLVGDHKVGKSNLLLRYAENQFVNEYIKSIGTDFKVVKGNTESGLNYTIQIWDYISHDHIGPFKSIATNNQVSVFILFLFDLTNKESFSNISKWIDDYNSDIKNGDQIIKILVANKLDLKSERSISEQSIKTMYNIKLEGQQSSDTNSFFKNYFEISVKEDTYIDQLFNYIIKEYEYQHQYQQQQQHNNSNNSNNNSNINSNNSKKKKFLFF